MKFRKSWDVTTFWKNLLSRVFYTRRYRWATEKAKKNLKFVNDFGRGSLMESCNSTD
jgi:hypothetical protein